MKSTLLTFSVMFITMKLVSCESLLDKLTSKLRPVEELCKTVPDLTLIPDYSDCQNFFLCINHKSEKYECPDNYYFNRIYLLCMPGSCDDADNDVDPLCEEHEIAAVNNHCEKFSFCMKGRREVFDCPDDQYFDTEHLICRRKENSADALCRCHLSNNTVFPNEDNCETYYTCSNGKAVLHQCPKGHYFNADINGCLLDVDGVCMEEPTMGPAAQSINDMCQYNGERYSIFQSYPDDCTKFYVCLGDMAVIESCEDGFYFDGELNFCRLDTDNKCVPKKEQMEEVIDVVVTMDEPAKSSATGDRATDIKIPMTNDRQSKYDKLSSKFVNF